jgi:mannitol 2-dehydrogenase
VISLRASNLAALGLRVAVPGYDRNSICVGVVHLGVGAFHRSHQAVYLDRLMNMGGAREWGICGVGVLSTDRRMQVALTTQDCLYTVVEKDPDRAAAPRVTGSIIEYLFAPDQGDQVIERMADPATRIVSLTITEGGYGIDVEGRFDPTAPDVVADLGRGDAPSTVLGLIVEALRRRRQRHLAPFTVLSCDNIQGNGGVARQAVTVLAGLRDRELGQWVGDEGRFPNSMVDRITPATTDADRAQLAQEFDVSDLWPVVCEPFMQWIVEDSFVDGRPRLEEVGVELVGDVAPYELMKLRLLNASHQAMCYAGYLAGFRLVHEVAADLLFAEFLLGYMTEEAVPTLSPVPGIDIPSYTRQLIARFGNPAIRDTLARLCSNSSDLVPKFLLPVLRYQLDHGGPIARCATVIACWARYARGMDEAGDEIVVEDRRRGQVVAAAQREDHQPGAFLQQRDIFGDLADSPRLRHAYLDILASLREQGVRLTLAEVVSQRPRSPQW